MAKLSASFLFLSVLLFQFLVGPGHTYSYDEFVIYQTSVNLVEEGSSHLEPTPEVVQYARRSPEGLWYSKFGMGMTAFLIPFYWSGAKLGIALGWQRPEYLGVILTMFANAFVIALTAVFLDSTVRRNGHTPAVAAVVTTLAVYSTSLCVYGRGLFNDALVALLILTAFRMFQYGRALFAGLAIAAVAATRLEFSIAAPAFFILWRDHRQRATFSIPIAAVLALLFVYNAARFGSPFDQGQMNPAEGDTFSTPLHIGLAGILLSPGKGLIWYAPVVILSAIGAKGFFRRNRRDALLIAGIAVPMLIVQSLWHSWMGGWSYGPRRMIALIPLLMLPAADAVAARTTDSAAMRKIALLGIAGFAMQIGGLTVNFMHYIRTAPSFWDTLWNPRYTAALGQLEFLARTGEWNLWYVRLTGGRIEMTSLAAAGVLLALFAAATAAWILSVVRLQRAGILNATSSS